MNNDDFDFIEVEQVVRGRRSLIDTIYSEPTEDDHGMLFGAPWNKITEYIYRVGVITTIVFVLFILALACGCT